MLKYELSELAERDFVAARRWYDQQGLELGNSFIDDVVAAIERACQNPKAYAEIEEGIRTVTCRRFPYRVFYVIAGDHMKILAIYHAARDPDRWDDQTRQ